MKQQQRMHEKSQFFSFWVEAVTLLSGNDLKTFLSQ
jgi:hypothetical protein